MKPIIFIPGIEATNLVNSNTFGFDIVWNAYDTLGTSAGTSLSGPTISQALQLNPLFDDDNATIVERSNTARFPYQQSMDSMMAKITAGQPDAQRYLFGYDWRLSCIENAKRLAAFLDYLTQKLAPKGGVEGFRFLTHSMGGMVFSAYLTLVDNYDHIDKVILCAPPFRGSPYALMHLVQGPTGINGFLGKIFNPTPDIRKVIRTYPALFELLPYYDNAITYTEDNSAVDLTDIDDWQSNIYDDIPELFKTRLNALMTFKAAQQQDFTKLPAEFRQRIMVVAGTQADTLTNVKVDHDNGNVTNFIRLDLVNQGNGSGDGTVPQPSSTFFNGVVRTLTVPKQNFFVQLNDNLDYHGLFLKDTRVQNIITRYFLSNEPAATLNPDGSLGSSDTVTGIWSSIDNSINNISPF